MSDESVRVRGLDKIDTYDNTGRVWERNTPFGNNWGF